MFQKQIFVEESPLRMHVDKLDRQIAFCPLCTWFVTLLWSKAKLENLDLFHETGTLSILVEVEHLQYSCQSQNPTKYFLVLVNFPPTFTTPHNILPIVLLWCENKSAWQQQNLPIFIPTWDPQTEDAIQNSIVISFTITINFSHMFHNSVLACS